MLYVDSCVNISNNCTSGVRGNCDGPNICKCKPGYSGDCDVYNCIDLKNCSDTNGNCIDGNVCSCNSGYMGEACDNYMCFNYTHDDRQVCSGNGMCEAPDICVCDTGYLGSKCADSSSSSSDLISQGTLLYLGGATGIFGLLILSMVIVGVLGIVVTCFLCMRHKSNEKKRSYTMKIMQQATSSDSDQTSFSKAFELDPKQILIEEKVSSVNINVTALYFALLIFTLG